MNDLMTAKAVFTDENVAFKSFYESGKNFLHFTFKNKFTYDSSIMATNAWKDYCDKNPSKKFVHIWDCQSMHGFDKTAKDLWMQYLDRYHGQTEKIVLVSDNIVIRGAARIMSRFTKHKLNVYKTFAEMAKEEL